MIFEHEKGIVRIDSYQNKKIFSIEYNIYYTITSNGIFIHGKSDSIASFIGNSPKFLAS